MSENESPYAGLAVKIRGGKSASTREIESRKPSIEITRKIDRGGFGYRKLLLILGLYEFAVDACTFRVLINGEQVGGLKRGETVRFELDAGEYDLMIKTPIAWNRKTVDLETGQLKTYLCQTSMTGILFWKRGG